LVVDLQPKYINMRFLSLLFSMLVTVLGFGQVSFTATNVLTLPNANINATDFAVGNFKPSNPNREIVYSNAAYPQTYDVTSTTNSLNIVELNNGVLSISSSIPYSGHYPLSIASGDFNDDGHDDITFSSYCNCDMAYLLQGSANGTYSIALSGSTGSYYMFRTTEDIAVGNVLDSKQSIAWGGNTVAQVKVKTAAAGSFGFTNFNTSIPNGSNASAGNAIADINGDGKGDFIAANPTAGEIRIYYSNSTSPYFSTSGSNMQIISVTNNGVSYNVKGVATGDIDGDGDIDIAAVIKTAANASAYIVLRNDGSNTFVQSASYAISDSWQGWIEMADLNGDGKSEIIIPDGNVKIYYANNGVFSATVSTQLTSIGARRVSIKDMNNDGLLDIAALGSTNVVVYLQGSAPTITTPPSTTAQNLCLNATPTDLSISASNVTSYQWSVANSANGTYTDISGATSSTFTPPTNVAGVFFYKCRAINGIGSTLSAASGAITVGVSAGNASSTPTLCTGTSMTSITHSTNGATSFGYPSGLPGGLNVSFSSNTLTISGTPSTTYSVGNYYNGGRIAYIFQPTDNGYVPGKVLIIDPSYKYGPECTGFWTMNGTTSITPTSTAIGEGLNNCNNLFASGTGHVSTSQAIGYALAYTDGTYSDWFVPSRNELAIIFNNLPTYTPEISGGFSVRSSSEIVGSLGQTHAYRRNNGVAELTAQNDGGCGAMMIARYDVLPAASASNTYNYTIPLTGSCGSASATGTITLTTDSYTWTGTSSNSPTTAGNWNPSSVPCNGSNITIPSGLSTYPTYSTLTINSGSTFTVQSGARLTVTGLLTNNGTLTLENGATLVQESGSNITGSGTYNVRQSITGANNGSAPNGRFWYLGSPVSLASSAVYFGNTANVLKKRNEAGNAWTDITNAAPENLVIGRGYYTQAMANTTINFTGGVINNGNVTIGGLTRTAGQGFEGFNLVSNPYPSYLNWDLVTKTNVGNTMWYRTNDGTNMVFDTYVANAAGGIGTNLGGSSVTRFIPPMQSFWVRVNQGQTSGSLTLGNAMRSHFTSLGGSTAGLKSINDEPSLFLRMNLLQASKKDQLIVYVNETATNGFDNLDGEKMMQATLPQFYTKAGDKKIVINGLNSAKKQQSLPITMELPTTGVHSFVIEDLEISNGLVWLEDKQEEIIQALEPGTVYEFYAASGMNAERFVLHFQLIDDAVPTNVYNEVNSSANFSGKGASVHAESAGVVVIKLPASTEGATDIQIRDAAGRLVYTGSTNTLETSVQLAQANGIYYVTLNSNTGVEVRKVFVQQ
jgi:hypothetical protein